ncbi:MAG: DNA helicase RecQ [Candidatus Cloacimonetes bacterium]|nr:DNA helicase RecQ [Candidatus Cloacimonadota bacterium]
MEGIQQEALKLLYEVFGYKQFRKYQLDIIKNLIQGLNSVVIMPTGSGKSLCYQIPALMKDGTAIVISPLISLMKNQVNQLQQFGVTAVFLNSSLSREEYFLTKNKIKSNKVKLLYLAPETLMLPHTFDLLSQIEISLIAVDEAHCISEWGHDFRPEYRQIAELRSKLNYPPTIALTATATPLVQADISKNLQLGEFSLFKTSFDRPNLFIEVKTKTDGVIQVIDTLERFKNQSVIIYCFSRNGVDQLSEKLNAIGYKSLPYHAGLDSETRKNNQDKFINDDFNIIVATIAFGMGIDKPDVRCVIHYDLPKDVESYYQQIGRAGRDGEYAYCLLLFSYNDIAKIKFLLKDKEERERIVAYNHLEAMENFVEDENCRRSFILNYFGEEHLEENCGTCDNCVKEVKPKEDLTIIVQKFLSCVYRTNEVFGAHYISKILRGSKDKTILERKHDELSTYGIGTDQSLKQWLFVYRQLLRNKIVVLDEEFGSVKLTDKAKKILKNEEKFMGHLIEETVKFTSQSGITEYNDKLFELLKKKRKELADEKEIPPYTIFHDKTLKEISATYPQSEAQLIQISGIGRAKLNNYGSMLLEIIIPFCKKNNLESKLSEHNLDFMQVEIAKTTRREARAFTAAKMYNQGFSVEEIQKEFGVKRERVFYYFRDFLMEGHVITKSLDSFLELDKEDCDKAYKLFSEMEILRLKPVFDLFEGKYSYDQLRICSLIYLNNLNKKQNEGIV